MIWGNILGLKNEGLGLFQYKEDFTLEKHRLLLQDMWFHLGTNFIWRAKGSYPIFNSYSNFSSYYKISSYSNCRFLALTVAFALIVRVSSKRNSYYCNSSSYSNCCLLYTSPSPRDRTRSRMPSSA